MKQFYSFSVKYNVNSPFPLSEHTLCCFAAYLATEGLAPQSIKGYLVALRNMQLSLGLPDPREQSSLPRLKRILAGITWSRLSNVAPARVRLPITATIMSQLHGAISKSSHPDKVVIWAIASIAFFGFFLLGELLLERADRYSPSTNLSWGDVAVDRLESPTMV